MNLRELVGYLEQANYVAGFLGETLELESKTVFIDMKQNGLIQHIIEVVGLDDGMVKSKFTL